MVPDFTFKSHVHVKCGKAVLGVLSSLGKRCIPVCLKPDDALFIIKIFQVPKYFPIFFSPMCMNVCVHENTGPFYVEDQRSNC